LTLFVVAILVAVYAVNVAEMIALRNEVSELKVLVQDKYLQSRADNLKEIAKIYGTIISSMEVTNDSNVDTYMLALNSAEMASTTLDMLHSIFNSIR